MSAEWAPHAATWMSWPFDEEMWHGHLSEVRKEYTEFVKTITRFEPVHLLLRDAEARATAESALAGIAGITFHDVALDDVWMRDNGPIFVLNAAGKMRATNWEFNSWGKKYEWDNDNLVPPQVTRFLHVDRYDIPVVMEGGSLEINGLGTCITTEQCLLTDTRNPTFGKPELEKVLRDNLGFTQVIWLNLGLEGDHTDGHVDTITRFSDEHTILTSMCEDTADINYGRMKHNFEILKAARDAKGQAFEVVELPLPAARMHLEDGTRLPATYANFYICNGAVIVPQYDDANDKKALAVIKSCFPNHEVIGLASRTIITGGGSFHCLTQQQPASK
ncbi:MAG: agmatine deiminase family protein [Chitinophagaceae bacterium]|nr:agmatine deiminase family protein [Oligoflexus sp.]